MQARWPCILGRIGCNCLVRSSAHSIESARQRARSGRAVVDGRIQAVHLHERKRHTGPRKCPPHEAICVVRLSKQKTEQIRRQDDAYARHQLPLGAGYHRFLSIDKALSEFVGFGCPRAGSQAPQRRPLDVGTPKLASAGFLQKSTWTPRLGPF